MQDVNVNEGIGERYVAASSVGMSAEAVTPPAEAASHPLLTDTAVVARASWETRAHAVLIPGGLVRDALLQRGVPAVGEVVGVSALGAGVAEFAVLAVAPRRGGGVFVVPPERPRVLWRAGVRVLWGGVLGVWGGFGAAAAAGVRGAVEGACVWVGAVDVLKRCVVRGGMLAVLKGYLDAAVVVSPCVLVFDDAHLVFGEGEDVAAASFVCLVEKLRAVSVEEGVNVGIVVIAAPALGALHETVRGVLDYDVRVELNVESDEAIKIAAERTGVSESALKELASSPDVRSMATLIHCARMLALDPERLYTGEVRRCAEAAQNGVSQQKQSESGLARSWTDNLGARLGGLQEAKMVLERVLLWRRSRSATFERLGIKPTSGILLYGSPCTGKTLLVRQAAEASGLSMLPVDAAMLARGEAGESERLLSASFKTASERAPCVLFRDEVDAMFPSASGQSTPLARLVAVLALAMDALPGGVVVVAATNRPWVISKSVIRAGRFDRCLLVPLPDAETRVQIADVYAREMRLDEDVWRALQEAAGGFGAPGFSGADIAGACRRAAMSALSRGSRIEGVDIEHAFSGLQPSVLGGDAAHTAAWRPPG